LIIKNSELSQKYELLKLVNHKQQDANLLNQSAYQHSSLAAKSSFKEEELSTNGVNQIDFEKYQQQLDENKSLRDDLNEKNKVN
jgi:hypothetical protein